MGDVASPNRTAMTDVVNLFSPRNLISRARKTEWGWRYGYNCRAALAYSVSRNGLAAEPARVIWDLNRSGVALTTSRNLFGGDHPFQELDAEVAARQRQLAEQIDSARESARQRGGFGEKTFMYWLLGEQPELDPGSIYARFALSDPILQIANAYFGMYTRLRYYNVWLTFSTEEPPHESQLWHRDREDYCILKVFVYLSDIDDGAGPLVYACGSHRKGTRRDEPEHFMEGGVKRSRDDQMDRVVPAGEWRKCVGPKGTIVFADTAGYHKGGLARERERLLYTCMFTSPASESPEMMPRAPRLPAGLDGARKFALGARRRGL
jgi:hypothetical protein